jgi:hypothetical protein
MSIKRSELALSPVIQMCTICVQSTTRQGWCATLDPSSVSPSNRRIRVLSASADPALRQSRELLLRSEGCEVATSLSKSHAHALIQTSEFDLLIFGNSLTPDACKELAKVFRMRHPRGKIIEILTAHWHPAKNQPDTTVVGPQELVSAIRHFAELML